MIRIFTLVSLAIVFATDAVSDEFVSELDAVKRSNSAVDLFVLDRSKRAMRSMSKKIKSDGWVNCQPITMNMEALRLDSITPYLRMPVASKDMYVKYVSSKREILPIESWTGEVMAEESGFFSVSRSLEEDEYSGTIRNGVGRSWIIRGSSKSAFICEQLESDVVDK